MVSSSNKKGQSNQLIWKVLRNAIIYLFFSLGLTLNFLGLYQKLKLKIQTYVTIEAVKSSKEDNANDQTLLKCLAIGKCMDIWIHAFIKDFSVNIGPAVRVFANGPGDLGSIPGRVIPKTLKMVLDTTLLNTQHYKVRFKGTVEQSWEWSSALPYTLV